MPVETRNPAPGAGIGDAAIDAVLRALASPLRRQILDVLRDGPSTTGAICASFPGHDRCTVMQHLRVLTDAGVVIAVRRGRERWNHLDAIPIRRLADRWINEYADRAVGLIDTIKHDVED